MTIRNQLSIGIGGASFAPGDLEEAVYRGLKTYSLEQKMAARMDWGQPGGPWAVGLHTWR